MKIYIVLTTRNYETEIVGVFESLELAKIEQEKSSRHYIQEFVLNQPYTAKYIWQYHHYEERIESNH